MSKKIDERVVSMQFDNSNFEKNVGTSLSTLDKLKQSLRLTESSKGLESLGSAAKGVDLSHIGSGVDAIQAKFSGLQVMAVTALANITNSAVNAGKKLVSAFTIEPMKTGLQEYETQINAVQTVLANTQSKGTTLKDVNGALDELNTYADKTIYNFTEMTRNIGTFTAAGVELDTSVSAIKGIANLAAVSGSNSTQASTAMYQLSQALAAGKVSLMDWNSVVTAGMGGEVFKNSLMETAKVHGIAIDDMIKEEGSFRETLQNGWLSSDILLETLNKFTGDLSEAQLKSMGYTGDQVKEIMKMSETALDAATKVKTFTGLMDNLKEVAQSGWTETWEILIGDFEQAKDLWTGVSKVMGKMVESSSKARNDLLKEWAKDGGRDMALEGLGNVFEGLLSVIEPIREAFREIFPPTTAEQLLRITEAFKNFSEHLKLSSSQSDKLKSTFKGLFAILDIIGTVIFSVVKGAVTLLGSLLGLGNGVLTITGTLGDWISKLRDVIKEHDLIGTAVDKVVGFLTKIIDKVKEFSGIDIKFAGWDGFSKVLMGIWEVVKKVGGAIKDFAVGIGSAIAGVINGNALDVFNAGMFVGLIKMVKGLLDSFDEVEEKVKLLDNVKGVLDQVRGSLESWQSNLKASTLLKLAGAIAILAAAILVISTIDPGKLAASLGAITVLFADLVGAMAIFDKMSINFKGAAKTSVMMLAMSTSILILASALKKISELSLAEIGKGLIGVAGLMIIMVKASEQMAANSGQMTKGATQMLIMAAALKVLASVCEDLAGLSWTGLAKGLVGISILLNEISIFLNSTKFSGKAFSTAAGILVLSVALKILASACGTFGQMNWSEISKGLVAIGVLLTEISMFTNLTGNATKVIATGVAMIAIAQAMKMFASAVSSFGDMSWGEIGRGLTAMAGALLAVSIAANLMPKDLIATGVGLMAVGAALLILANALGSMGNMSWGEIGRGLTVLGGSLFILAIGLNAMTGTIGGSAALLIAAASLMILTPVLQTLGSMTWGEIAKGLLTIAGVFTVLGVAGALLYPVVPAILGLSAAVALFGIGCLAAGVGITALATGLSMLATSAVVGATAIVAALNILVVGILGIIPQVVDQITQFILALCDVIIQSAPALGKAAKALILSLIDVLVECVPALAEGLLKVVVGAMEALVEYTPQLVNLLFQFLIGIFDSVAARAPELAQSGINMMMAVFGGIMDALGSIDPDALLKGIAGVALLTGLMYALAGLASLVPAAMVGVLGLGVLVAELALVLAAIGKLSQISGLDWMISEGGYLLQTIGTAIGQFVGGIVGGVAQGITSSLPQIANYLSEFMNNIQPFIDGASKINESSLQGVNRLVDIILTLTAASLIDKLTSWVTGGSSMTDFVEDLVPFGEAMAEFSNAVSGNIDEGAVMAAANAGKIMAEMANVLPNSGGLAGIFAGENDMADFGTNLISFGEAIAGFSLAVDGKVNDGAVTSAANAGKVMAEMANAIPNSGGIFAAFTGDNGMDTFSTQLIIFGEAIAGFSAKVDGNVNESAVDAAANAGKMMTEMVASIPDGNIFTLFSAAGDMATFAAQLVLFGDAITAFSSTVDGKVNESAVDAAANAGTMMTEMVSSIPDGNIFNIFSGVGDMAAFATQLILFGDAITAFSSTVDGKVNEGAVQSAVNAGTMMNAMVSAIPDGGIFNVFNGVSDMAGFATQLQLFGDAITSFSTAVAGKVNEDAVLSASNAGRVMAGMVSAIPDGGIFNVFAGVGDMAGFATQLTLFGDAITSFSTAVAGKVNEDAVLSASNAGKMMAGMVAAIPDGGIFNVFAGVGDMAGFATQLTTFGSAITAFSEAVAGKVNEDAVQSASNAGRMMTEMVAGIPDAGIFGIFSAAGDMNSFATQLTAFGGAITAFSEAVAGKVNEEAVSAAANAGRVMAGMAASIPDSSVFQMFLGAGDLTLFGSDLVAFGDAIVSFSETVSGGTVNIEAITSVASAGSALAQMAASIPDNGFFSMFDGVGSMEQFGTDLKSFGDAIKEFSKSVSGIALGAIENGVGAGKMVVSLGKTLSEAKLNIGDMAGFKTKIKAFGEAVQDYAKTAFGIGAGAVDNGVSAGKKVIDLAKTLTNAKLNIGDMTSFKTNLMNFAKAIKEFGTEIAGVNGGEIAGNVDKFKGIMKSLKDVAKTGVSDLVNAFKDGGSKVANAVSTMLKSATKEAKGKEGEFNSAGKALVTKFCSGIESLKARPAQLFKAMGADAVSAVQNGSIAAGFQSAGARCAQGFANGITSNQFKAAAAARAMASAARVAAESALKIKSPSRVFYGIGGYTGQGLVNAMIDYIPRVYAAGSKMANSAIDGLSNTIAKISDVIEGNMDVQPTIRPIIDLSAVTSGANAINDMLGLNPSIGVLSNVGSISKSMNRRQNGSNDDVVSAIKSLEKTVSDSSGDQYNVGDITYDDGSNITEAVKEIVRAARVERRV